MADGMIASLPTDLSERARRNGSTTVGDIMRAGIVSCARSASPTELARIMRVCRTDCVVVLSNGHSADEHPIVWGLVTESDLARPLALDSASETAEALATTHVIRARADLTVAAGEALLAATGVSHLLVIDPEHGTPLGVVSARTLAQSHHEEVDVREDSAGSEEVPARDAPVHDA